MTNGEIVFENVDSLEPAKAIVVKKMSGSLFKKFEEEIEGEKKLVVTVLEDGVKLKLEANGTVKEAEEHDANLFVALNKAFQKLEQ